MARTIAQIQQSIQDAKNGINPDLPLTGVNPLAGLTSTSNVSMWLLWTYVIAVCQWLLENLFDLHVSEVNSILATQKPHTLQWYVTKAKAFQFGDALPADTDLYSVVDAGTQIVKYAAAIELDNMVRIKVAKITGAALTPLDATLELPPFTAYMQLIKDAGVRLNITSGAPDTLKLVLNIYYDPLVLDSTGARLDGTSTTPVKDAINNFLVNLPFNGLFVINNLIATLQSISGVVIGQIADAQATYAALPYIEVLVEYTPDAGYMILDPVDGLTINYYPHGPI